MSEKKTKAALIGAFGGDKPTTTGRIIRTRIICEELKQRLGEENVIKLSTEDNCGLRVWMRCLIGTLRADIIMLFVSEAGMRLLFPMVSLLAKLTGKRVYNSVIGGHIPTVMEKYPLCAKAMNSFEVNWVQMPSMVPMLEKVGVHNAEFLPNAKPYYKTSEDVSIQPYFENRILVCTFSRIIADKGIEEAIHAVRTVHEKGFPVELHLYGEIFEGYKKRFNEIMLEAPEYIKYCGIVDYHENINTLIKYYILLFPSTYKAEGFPGTLTDAFFSGLPTIATDWNYNRELLQEGKTGFLYHPQEPERLAELLEYAVKNPDKIKEMRRNCMEESKKYSYNSMISKIFGKVVC